MSQDERYYNSRKLTIIFAISSVLLLLSVLWMFKADYDREWKVYQERFRDIEVEKTRVKFDRAALDLEDTQEHKDLLVALDEERKNFEANCASTSKQEKELKELESISVLIDQKYKFAKAELDADKYRYEHGTAHQDKNADHYKEVLDAKLEQVAAYKLELEKATTELKAKQNEIASCGQKLADLEKQEKKVASQKLLLERKLKKVDPNEMTFINRIAEMVRDQPVIDLANPNNKIEQIVLKDITDDVNFMNVPKVERCITCHLGIANPDYANEPQPFTTHPNLELYIDKNSPHPVEDFGCTSCHNGRARGTSFNAAVHVPSSEAQKKEWEEKYDYHQIELWEEPMYPLQYTQAGCFKCHSGESRIKGAETLNTGMSLIEKAGCYACHEIDKYKDWPKPGPTLNHIASKVSKEWAFKWINDPHSFRHNTWMPSFFNQSNNDDPTSKKRTEQEIHSILHYLFENSEPFAASEKKSRGDVKKGEELVKSIGCFACHQVEPNSTMEKTTAESLHRRHGPNLINLGSKVSIDWLYTWLKDPTQYHPETIMPNLRLTDSEALDIATYLHQDKNEKFDQKQIPQVNVHVLNDIILGFLKRSQTDTQARATLATMKLEKKMYFAGEKLIAHYGCYSCHDIKGFDKVKPIGAVLTQEGDKSIHKLDFGFVHIDHSKHAWFKQKLMDPRIFDQGKIKLPDEKLRMPNFQFKEHEADAIVTALLGFVDNHTVKSKVKPRTPENLLKEKGQEIVTQMNCQGCHMIQGEGGSIAATMETWLKEYDGRTDSDAAKVRDSFSPPNLHGIGKKLDPEWLFNFLHQPNQVVRPWLKTRMPTFNFNVDHLNALVEYFQTIDGDTYAHKFKSDYSLSDKEYKAAEELFGSGDSGLDCTLCHVVGNKLPSGAQDSWAPNLALAQDRLQPEWILEWIRDPSSLMPGTKMPTFFVDDQSGPPDILNGDENEQIRVLRNFLLSLADNPAMQKATTPSPKPVAPKVSAPAETGTNEASTP